MKFFVSDYANKNMNKTRVFPLLGSFLVFATAFVALNPGNGVGASQLGGKTLVLYDGSAGATPESPLMGFTDFPPGAAQPAYAEGVTLLDTTVLGEDTYAGWVSSGSSTPGFPILDRTAGFQVNVTLQLERESHSNNNRAGFSIIVLADDARGVELGFWENEIWAQSDGMTGGLFRRAEGIAFAANAGLADYQITIVGDTYTLAAGGLPILTGPVRDYSAFDEFPDPYETPNFLFLGDDTTSAEARVRLSSVSVTGSEPATPTVAATVTSTSSPLPTLTTTPSPSPTPLPPQTATPSGGGFALCPSGWLVFLMAAGTVMRTKSLRVG